MVNVPIPQLECVRCGHKWIARKATVQKCPHCKSIYWDVPKSQKRLVTARGVNKVQKHLISMKAERKT
jgi:Zn finger protein HypA/HybF involved in hydrogenase expression